MSQVQILQNSSQYYINMDRQRKKSTPDQPEQISICDAEHFRYEVSDLEEGKEGIFDQETLTIIIPEKNLNNDSTILHKMIHLYEYAYSDLPVYFHDALLWGPV
ncbi:hypothetical protein [Oribacterium sp. Sow4_G1_1]|uniref:hypothetical protein n=1 Tax=Oribacterium sp. Sow4_G1_1 TaxID=3438794 RepID=UPI003F94F851